MGACHKRDPLGGVRQTAKNSASSRVSNGHGLHFDRDSEHLRMGALGLHEQLAFHQQKRSAK